MVPNRAKHHIYIYIYIYIHTHTEYDYQKVNVTIPVSSWVGTIMPYLYYIDEVCILHT